MSLKLRCYTLFDITVTGITNRRNVPVTDTAKQAEWERKRNTQCNFDTILQIISLRSQPENITDSIKTPIRFSEFNKFGFLFDSTENDVNCWNFEFTVNFKSVFDDGISELGSLYNDCDSVPMILVGTEWDKLPSFLDTSPELKNIYFEALPNDYRT